VSIDIDEQNGRTVVVVGGEIDTATSSELERQLMEAVEHTDRDVALDLSDVGFLDSSGLRTLLVAQQAVAAKGHRVLLVGSTPMVDRLLEVTGLRDLFPTT
jgi:anti-sigma B factor antagonist